MVNLKHFTSEDLRTVAVDLAELWRGFVQQGLVTQGSSGKVAEYRVYLLQTFRAVVEAELVEVEAELTDRKGTK